MARTGLSPGAATGTSPAMAAGEPFGDAQRGPFDRRLRRIRRDRALAGWAEHAFIQRRIADEMLERLEAVQRDFARALVLGDAGPELIEGLRQRGMTVTVADPGYRLARAAGGVQVDEDRLPFADGSFDLIVSVGLLDTVNDLPGALTLIRRALVPDGLFLAGFLGAGSLAVLRRAMLEADLAAGAAAARIHPQIDLQSAGDLLGRAGFALPVVDSERLTVRYPGFDRLLADLRGAAGTSLLGGPPLSRPGLAAAVARFEAERRDGRVAETFEIVYLTGWSPAPDQPKPARRGSATASLAAALRPRS